MVTPQYTTVEMRERTNNANFAYELVCDQLCGSNHYAMKGAIEVITQAEFDAKMAGQKPNFYTVFPKLDPTNKATAKDSASATNQTTPATASLQMPAVKGNTEKH